MHAEPRHQQGLLERAAHSTRRWMSKVKNWRGEAITPLVIFHADYWLQAFYKFCLDSLEA